MNFEEFKQYLEDNKDNKDVQQSLKGFVTVSSNDVESFLETEEGKRFIQPKLDKYHNKSLESWKKNNLDNLVEEEVRRRHPEETEDQKRIRKLEEELANRDKQSKRQELQNKAIKIAQNKGLPTDLVDFFIGEDEEATQTNLDKFEEKVNEVVTNKVDQRFKDNGRDFNDATEQTNVPASTSIQSIIEGGNIRN